MKTLSYFYEPIIKIFDYKGRATRSQYWIWFGINALWYFYLNPYLFTPMVGQSFSKIRLSMSDYSAAFSWIGLAQGIVIGGSWILPYVTLLAITARRMRDANAATWLFKAFIAGHGIAVIFVPLMFANLEFALLAIPGLIMMALFGVGCMIKGLEPSYVAPVSEELPYVDRLEAHLAKRAQDLFAQD